MKVRVWVLAPSRLALVVLMLAFTTGASRPAWAASCSPSWSIDQLPDSGSATSFYGSAAGSSVDVWAVGSFFTGQTDQPRIERWNGTSWGIVASPAVRAAGYLEAIDDVSATSAWAVGYFVPRSGGPRTLTEHWNGATWRTVASPNVAGIANYLVGVSAAAHDAWAVGYRINGSGVYRTLAERWNGTSWSVIPTPNVASGDNLLQSVWQVSATDVWAVGFSTTSTGSTRTLAEHWDGSSWRVVPSPSPGSNANSLAGVTGVSSSDLWAVGSFYDGTNNLTLVERWNGTAWSVSPSPNVAAAGNVLSSVGVGTASDAWAVGYYYPRVGDRDFEPLTLHWDGGAWTVIATPQLGSGDSYLRSVSVLATGATWAVGSTTAGALVLSACQ